MAESLISLTDKSCYMTYYAILTSGQRQMYSPDCKRKSCCFDNINLKQYEIKYIIEKGDKAPGFNPSKAIFEKP